ncbi:hypothetical protein K469DRAFT_692705 [Zopfia rhizophila CBS 207.26]|uniref:Rhodopsin domain-containing protein n=1 Tax=Zopfia rhizophila CBS 207.26 TaxID=1314779 RepID=A0A6A6DNC8_9PEZI|nr:hypothetical protein K469DRAFT_692705 [Zopfia rhizophila CBS 207.26]
MLSGGVRVDTSDKDLPLNIINWILLVMMWLAAFIKLVLSDAQVENYQKASMGSFVLENNRIDMGQTGFASQLMYAVSLGFAKQIILQLFANLSRNSRRRHAVYGVMSSNLVLSIAILFPIAFQCIPDGSSILSPKCFNQANFESTPFELAKLVADVPRPHSGKHLQ